MALQNVTNSWSTTLTASSSGSLLVNNIPSFINTLHVVFYNFSGTTGTTPMFQLSVNNGSSFITSGYQSGVAYFTSSGTGGTGQQNSSSGLMFSYIPAAAGFHSGSVYLHGFNSSNIPLMEGTTTIQNQTSSSSSWGVCGGSLVGTTGVNAFQIVTLGGTMLTGTFKIYGVT